MGFSVKMAAAAASILAVGGLALAASPAHASTPLVSATTSITNDAATGGDGEYITSDAQAIWAYDDFTRTLTITIDPTQSDCDGLASFSLTTDTCYTAAIADSGTAATIPSRLQPNQGSSLLFTTPQTLADQTGAKLGSPTETVPFSGQASYLFWATNTNLPNSANVQASHDYGDAPDYSNSDAGYTTQEWYAQAFPEQTATSLYLPTGSDTPALLNTWSWTYSNSCETWTDSYANNNGQSSPLTVDGNITANSTCTPTPPPVTGTLSDYGNEVNPSGNGFDVFQQHFAVNAEIAGWEATQGDVATHFLRVAEGSNWSFEAAPNGSGDGLCVSNPEGGYAGDPGGPTGLVLRDCNGSIFQQFYASSGYLHSAADGQYVNPDGTGAALRTASSPVSWGGSKWTWTPYASLP